MSRRHLLDSLPGVRAKQSEAKSEPINCAIGCVYGALPSDVFNSRLRRLRISGGRSQTTEHGPALGARRCSQNMKSRSHLHRSQAACSSIGVGAFTAEIVPLNLNCVPCSQDVGSPACPDHMRAFRRGFVSKGSRRSCATCGVSAMAAGFGAAPRGDFAWDLGHLKQGPLGIPMGPSDCRPSNMVNLHTCRLGALDKALDTRCFFSLKATTCTRIDQKKRETHFFFKTRSIEAVTSL